MGPRVYMALINSIKTGFEDNLSRKYHSYFVRFNSPEIADTWVTPLTTALGIEGERKSIQGSYGPSQPIVVRSFRDINNGIIQGFAAMNQFFLFLSLFILLLSGTAFGFIIWTCIIQKIPEIGNLRYLGLSIRKIHQFYIKEAIKIASITTAIGLGSGAIIAQLCQWFIGQQMNIPFAWITIHPSDILLIGSFSIIGMYAMTRSVLILTKSTGLFHHEQPQKISLTIIGIMGLAILGFITIFLMLNHIPMTQIFRLTGLFLGIFMLLGIIDLVIFSTLKKLPTKSFTLPTRLAIRYLSEGHTIRRMAFISICFSLIAIMSIAHYEASLNEEFNPQKPNKTLPSLFLMDLYKYQLNDLKTIIPTHHYLSPLVRTRIRKINGQHLSIYKKNRRINAAFFLHREQNLSSRSTLSDEEALIEGDWFDPNNDIMEISVEKRFAKKIQLRLNDEIEFSIVGFPFKGTVTSIRSVDWSTFQPNFFMLIEPPYLEKTPQTWIGAIYTQSEDETLELQASLTAKFPNIRIIDIQNTSQNILSFFKTFIVAFKLGAMFSFFIGGLLFLLLGKLYSDIRQDSYAMLHWIGLGQSKIERISLTENICFSMITYLCAFLISLAICHIIFTAFVPIPLVIHWSASLLLLIGLISAVIFQWYSKKKTIV